MISSDLTQNTKTAITGGMQHDEAAKAAKIPVVTAPFDLLVFVSISF